MKGLMMKKASPITLENYLETAAPKAFGKMKRTWAVCRFPGDAGENSPEFKQRREAHVQCRQALLEGHEEGKFEVHGRNRGDLMSCFAVLDQDRQRAVLEQWKYSPDMRPAGVVYLPDLGDVEVRVFRSRVWQDSTKFVCWAKEKLEEKYKAWALITAGKPQDRKPKAEILSELMNEKPELSPTGAAKAWKKADIPKWKRRGFIKGRPRKLLHPMG